MAIGYRRVGKVSPAVAWGVVLLVWLAGLGLRVGLTVLSAGGARMSPLKRALIAVGVVAVLAAIVVASIRSRAAEGTKVYTEPVGRRDMVARVKASGEIDPRVKVKISAHVIGRIEKLFVKEGDRIEAGQPFLELEQTGFVAARDQSAALLQSAETAVRQAEVDLADARRQERRAVELSAEGIVTQEQLDAVHLRATSAELNLDRARDGVRQARAALDKARDDLAKTTIFAPLAGRVIELNAEEGEVVVSGTMNNPASVIGTIADLSELLAVVDVDETEIVDVALGQEATVDVDAVPGTTYHGQVVEVGSSGYDKPRQPDVTYFRVKVLIADADDGLRPGMSARVAIRTAGHDGRAGGAHPGGGRAAGRRRRREVRRRRVRDRRRPPALPAKAQEPEKVVFLVAAGKAKRQAVTTGIADTTHVEITSGLAGGEEVVTGPYRSLRDLKDGEAVRVTTPEAAEKEKGGKGGDAKDGKDDKDENGTMSLIELADVTKVYDMGDVQVHALNGVDLAIEQGEYVAIMGVVGQRQVDPDEPGRLPRHPDGRHLHPQRRRGPGPRRLRPRRHPQPGDRLRLPDLQPARPHRRPAQRRAAPGLRRRRPPRAPPAGAGGARPGRPRATASATSPTSCPAASGSGSPSPARWSTARRSCSPTSPPATSTRRPPTRSWRCSTSCTPAATP